MSGLIRASISSTAARMACDNSCSRDVIRRLRMSAPPHRLGGGSDTGTLKRLFDGDPPTDAGRNEGRQLRGFVEGPLAAAGALVNDGDGRKPKNGRDFIA